MGTDFMTCLCCQLHLWPLVVLHPPPVSRFPSTYQDAAPRTPMDNSSLSSFFLMGDHRAYHHGAPGAMGGHGEVRSASMGSKQQEGYQYGGGLGDSLGVQYDQCPTEQRFQVGKIRLFVVMFSRIYSWILYRTTIELYMSYLGKQINLLLFHFDVMDVFVLLLLISLGRFYLSHLFGDTVIFSL